MTNRKRFYSRNLRTKKEENNWPLLKRLIIILFFIFLILTVMYFWVVTVFSNINVFWEIFFPRKESFVTEKDTIAPPPPYLSPPPSAINQKNITLSGFSEEGATVTLFLNEEKYTSSLADKQGAFSFEGVNLKRGENKLYATAKDSVGNESLPSAEVTIIFDKESPDLEVLKPGDKEEIKKKESNLFVEGKTEPEATVTINGHRAVVDPEGNFKMKISLKEGENKIEIIAEDRAGNQTTIERTVIYSREE